MKKFSLALVLMVPMVLSSCSAPKEKSEAEIITEQISAIDSLLTSNAPVTTNSYRLGEVGSYDKVIMSVQDIIYKDDSYKFISLYGNERNVGGYGYNEGMAIVLPQEVNELCANIDSIKSNVNKEIDHTQTISYTTKGGLTVSASNLYENHTPWEITVKLHYDGRANIIIKEYDLGQLEKYLKEGKAKLNSL